MKNATPRTRRIRSDYARNRNEIVDSADRQFRAAGVHSSLETVARDAGVGSATLYRHFPTRDALLAEVLQRRVDDVESERDRIMHLVDAGDALIEWLRAMEAFFSAYEGLPGPLRDAFLEAHNPLTTTCTGFIATTDEFVRAAQREGKAHDGLCGKDLFLAALALSWVRGAALTDEGSHHRLRALVGRGCAPGE